MAGNFFFTSSSPSRTSSKAFTMIKNAQDVMMGAPSTVEQKQLDELHIQITALEEE